MPFYLVTQTTLIEADNEEAAAQNAIDRICSGVPVAVCVKFDEAAISHITVAAKCEVPEHVRPGNAQADDHHQPTEKIVAVDEKGKRAVLKRVMADARSLMSWRT